MKEKNKAAQELGKKRWAKKTTKEKRDHALMMVSKRKKLDTTAS